MSPPPPAEAAAAAAAAPPDHHHNNNEKPLTTKQQKAQQIWDNAPHNLELVDLAWVFQHHQCREFPTFDDCELKVGPRLGQGGFSNVFEIEEIHLNKDKEEKEQETTNGDSKTDQHQQSSNGDSTDSAKKSTTTITTTRAAFSNSTHSSNNNRDDHEEHYDVNEARHIMAKRCTRFGSARYAIKRLRGDLDEVEYARGALDLAIEIKFLSTLYHPNIVKMRAYSNTPTRLTVDTFIVMGTFDLLSSVCDMHGPNMETSMSLLCFVCVCVCVCGWMDEKISMCDVNSWFCV
jgi:serine/threonine protein kinase